MRRVEERLAHWQHLYKLLEDARGKLKTAGAGPARRALESEVHRLEREGDAALDGINTALTEAQRSARRQ